MDTVLRLAAGPIINRYFASKIDWTIERNNTILYTTYGVIQSAVLLVYLYIYLKISKVDRRRKYIKTQKDNASNPMMAMMSMAQFVSSHSF